MVKKYEDAHEAFRKHINEEINIWDEIDFSQPGEDLSHLEEKLKEDIEISLRRKLITQALRFRAKVDVSCSQFEGIDAIKEALLKGLEASSEECEVKVQLVAHPMFMLTCATTDKQLGLASLEKAISLIKACIEAKGGEFCVRLAPELVGHNEQEDQHEEGSGSEDGSESDSDEEQDETMGNLDEKALAELMAKEVVDDDE